MGERAAGFYPPKEWDEALDLPGQELPSDSNEYQDIWGSVRESLGWERNTFPGGQPVSLCSSNISMIFKHPYVACEKTDGIRFLLYGNSRVVYLIGRRNEIRRVEEMGLCNEECNGSSGDFGWTLYDGELVLDKTQERPEGQWRYLVYDCMVIQDNWQVKDLNLLQRLYLAKKNVLKSLICGGNQIKRQCRSEKSSNSFEIYIKDFFEVFDLENLQKLSVRLPHPSDGIIFTPINQPYKCGTCPSLLKWKPPHLNSVDFAVCKHTPNEAYNFLRLCQLGYGGVIQPTEWFLAPYGDAYPKVLNKAMTLNDSSQFIVVECFWTSTPPVYTLYPPNYYRREPLWRSGGWIAERIRDDKLQPNFSTIVQKVKRVSFRNILCPTNISTLASE